MIVYKVLSNYNGKLFSANPYLSKKIRLRYYKNKPTCAQIPNSKLFVFKEIKYAFDFRDIIKFHGNNKLEIWEAETLNKVKPNPIKILSLALTNSFDEIARFWNSKDFDGRTIFNPLVGTLLVKSLKLIKKVG